MTHRWWKRPRFYVEIHVGHTWVRYEWYIFLPSAMAGVDRLQHVNQSSAKVFDGVRLRYRGLTLHRWDV